MVERVAAAAGVLSCQFVDIPQNPAFDLRNVVSTTGNRLVASLALPDPNSLALNGVLAAEGADVAGVLGDFHLLHLLTQRSTVPGRVNILPRIQFESIRVHNVQ